MLRFKKKPRDDGGGAAAGEAAAPAAEAAGGGAAGGAGPAGDDGKVSVLEVGGRSGRAGSGKRKLSPGEIRVRKDIEELDAGRVAQVEWPDPSNLMICKVVIKPESGLWRHATYEMTITVPRMYPHEPPKVHCDTPIFHPNIDWEGNVCLNILRKDWKPVLDLNAVIYGLITLFYEPNANDPLNHEAADELRSAPARFEENVRRSLRGASIMGHHFPRLL